LKKKGFTAMRNGRYSLSALARARNAVHQFARKYMPEVGAQEAPPAAPPQRPRSAAPGDQEETV